MEKVGWVDAISFFAGIFIDFDIHLKQYKIIEPKVYKKFTTSPKLYNDLLV